MARAWKRVVPLEVDDVFDLLWFEEKLRDIPFEQLSITARFHRQKTGGIHREAARLCDEEIAWRMEHGRI